jgi:hypothetical protein
MTQNHSLKNSLTFVINTLSLAANLFTNNPTIFAMVWLHGRILMNIYYHCGWKNICKHVNECMYAYREYLPLKAVFVQPDGTTNVYSQIQIGFS